ncbi:MAG: helix-turn-helix transcriptional regulator [Acidobacteria bacterium]|nr:helix-turn-helix transcriptional regulator [Acidobacteriota bacterium]
MARKFSELESKMDPAVLARSKSDAQKLIELMELHELRRARKRSQVDLAKKMKVAQSEVSKIENRTDMRISTLQQYVESLGGTLEMRAVFPDAEVRIEMAS